MQSVRILLYEHITGGGRFIDPQLNSLTRPSNARPVSPDARWSASKVHDLNLNRQPDTMPFAPSLLREGQAMRDALTADFAAIPDVEVRMLVDERLSVSSRSNVTELVVHDAHDLDRLLTIESSEADWTVVIAPELDGVLLRCCAQVESAGGRLLGGSLSTIRLASDKHSTAVELSRAGVRVPSGQRLAANDPWPHDMTYPCVLKPCDGAGSQEVYRLHSPPRDPIWPRMSGQWRVEHECPGRSASVAWLCGPQGHVPLAPVWQRLSDDGRFAYLGGALSMPERLSSRALQISRQAIESLPSPLGYIGVDLVLGDDPGGDHDVVIEVNPRLTTSYVGLRAATEDNLARAMLRVAEGEPIDLRFDVTPLEFDADGTIRRLAWV